MKKILLLFFVLSWLNNTIAQQCNGSLPVSEDFGNTTEVSACWNFIDNDNDTHNWQIVDLSGNKGLVSESKTSSGGILYPDNWAITTYAVDLTPYNTNSNIYLNWKVRASSWSFDKERYTVYVSTGNQMVDFESSPVSKFEDLDNSDASGSWGVRNLSISPLAGNYVYIAFRHHKSVAQREINIDDIIISASALGIEDFNKENFKFFYAKDTQSLIVKSVNNPISSVKIYNILGQTVVNKTSSDYNENLNLSSLVDGMYIAQVEIDNTIKSIKFLKH